MQYQLTVGVVQVLVPFSWIDHRQIRPALAMVHVIMAEDCYPCGISDHVFMNLLPPSDQ
jgi:hypothetical protein